MSAARPQYVSALRFTNDELLQVHSEAAYHALIKAQAAARGFLTRKRVLELLAESSSVTGSRPSTREGGSRPCSQEGGIRRRFGSGRAAPLLVLDNDQSLVLVEQTCTTPTLVTTPPAAPPQPRYGKLKADVTNLVSGLETRHQTMRSTVWQQDQHLQQMASRSQLNWEVPPSTYLSLDLLARSHLLAQFPCTCTPDPTFQCPIVLDPCTWVVLWASGSQNAFHFFFKDGCIPGKHNATGNNTFPFLHCIIPRGAASSNPDIPPPPSRPPRVG